MKDSPGRHAWMTLCQNVKTKRARIRHLKAKLQTPPKKAFLRHSLRTGRHEIRRFADLKPHPQQENTEDTVSPSSLFLNVLTFCHYIFARLPSPDREENAIFPSPIPQNQPSFPPPEEVFIFFCAEKNIAFSRMKNHLAESGKQKSVKK